MLTTGRTALLAVLTATLLAGCAAQPPGSDGNLLDEWQPMAAAAWDLPVAGDCLDGSTRSGYDSRYTPIKTITCDRGHPLEVAAVLQVDGAAATATAPPAAGSDGYQAAYAACSKAAGEYVGGDWTAGMLGIQVILPAKARWDGGLRSYLCAVYELSNAYGTMMLSSASLKGTMAGAAPKAMRCLAIAGTPGADGWWEKLDTLTAIDCAQPHDAEFVGTVQIGAGATGPMPEATVITDWAKDRCWPLAAAYVGVPNLRTGGGRDDLGISWDRMDKDQWDAGMRFLRCFVLTDPGKKARGSIKGLGTRALPV